MNEVMKIRGESVKEAAGLMKCGKGDVSGGYSSDAILNGPDVLFDQLAAVFRSWCVHGTVTPSLLACAFLPLLKSSLKNPADPASYRAITGSSIILKLFDKVVLLLWGHKGAQTLCSMATKLVPAPISAAGWYRRWSITS